MPEPVNSKASILDWNKQTVHRETEKALQRLEKKQRERERH